MKTKTKQSDPVIDEIREVRHQISARFNHDPGKLVEYYMQLQDQYGDRLMRAPANKNLVQPSRAPSPQSPDAASTPLGVSGAVVIPDDFDERLEEPRS